MTSTASTATPVHNDFEQRVDHIRAPKSNINALILNYLTLEGYPKAAEKFCKEANLEPPPDIETTELREQIQTNILSGNIASAIESLNELNPDILEGNEAVHFALLRLQLVELIRQCEKDGGNYIPAIMFAREKLGPRASQNPAFLDDLEKTMTLIFFPHDTPDLPTIELLHPNLRRQVAECVNRTITQTQSQKIDASIRSLISARCWAEKKAREVNLPLPDHLDFGMHGEESGSSTVGNGQDSMVTT